MTMHKFYIISTLVFCGALMNVFSMPNDIKQINHIKPYGLTEIVNQTIEDLRADLPENFTIPGQVNITLPDNLAEIISGDLGVSDLTIEGINGFLIPYLEVSTTRAQLTLVFPYLDVLAGYIADVSILATLPIYGNGSVFIDLYNLQIKVDAGLTLTPMQLTELHLDIELEKLQLDIGGISYDEESSQEISALITSVANEVVVPYINNNSKEIGEALSGPVMDFINGLLQPNNTSN